MIIPHDQIAIAVKELWEKGGLPRGSLTGWPSVDELYTVGMGQWTLVTGTPNSGKSEWLDAMMVNLVKREPWKFVIYSPENHPVETHHAKIIEKYIGKPFNPGFHKRVDEEELSDSEAWMHGKFLFAKPDRPDIATILTEAAKAAQCHTGSWKLGVVVDPWNHLEHYRPHGYSETEYVSDTLSKVIAWTRETNAHVWIVAHPSKMQKSKDGKLPVPTPHDVSGSAHFWNKADNCICVWRDQSDYRKQEVDVHVQKVRFKHIGHMGMATLIYDRVTGRYSEKLQVVEGKKPYAE